MSASPGVTGEQWVEIDTHLLACDQSKAIRRVRELIGTGPEEAVEFVRLRFQRLRSTRPDDFAWNRFPCGDYLSSKRADQGCWCEESQTMIIVPAWEVEVLDEIGLLAVGGPGIDGIRWGSRRGEPGVWAYYPIEMEFTYNSGDSGGLGRDVGIRQTEALEL